MKSISIDVAQYTKTLATIVGNALFDKAEEGITTIARQVSRAVPEANAAEAPIETPAAEASSYEEAPPPEAHDCVVWTRTDLWNFCADTSGETADEPLKLSSPSAPSAPTPAQQPKDCVVIEGGACIAREKLKVGEQKEDIFEFYGRILSQFSQSAGDAPKAEMMGGR